MITKAYRGARRRLAPENQMPERSPACFSEAVADETPARPAPADPVSVSGTPNGAALARLFHAEAVAPLLARELPRYPGMAVGRAGHA
jgi:hypothetical protein